ncbi:MAG: hypothetical protein BMS9Abin31_0286 [Gammaproteobacteria bacterium]|nr:MAG: hypothetical protein BMS9Abin31_0286 [Gammaproteobacteria bacterium]
MTTQTEITNKVDKITEKTKIIPAANARMFARLFNIGNLLSFLPGLIVAPIILLTELERISTIFMFIAMIVPPILWFGLSIMIYIIARHHPNQLVGHYTQQAAYRYYGLIGVIIPIGTFFGTDWKLWILMGGVVGLVIVPWTVWELIKTQKENWQDIEVVINQNEGEMA